MAKAIEGPYSTDAQLMQCYYTIDLICEPFGFTKHHRGGPLKMTLPHPCLKSSARVGRIKQYEMLFEDVMGEEYHLHG